MLINSVGDQEEFTCFEPDDKTDAYGSCSINWRNLLFIFGGANEPRQISRLDGYKLKRVHDLLFDYSHGSCSVMKDKFIFLCFGTVNETEYRQCRRSTGPFYNFQKLAESKHDHDKTKVSCSEGELFCPSSQSLANCYRYSCCSEIKDGGREIQKWNVE